MLDPNTLPAPLPNEVAENVMVNKLQLFQLREALQKERIHRSDLEKIYFTMMQLMSSFIPTDGKEVSKLAMMQKISKMVMGGKIETGNLVSLIQEINNKYYNEQRTNN